MNSSESRRPSIPPRKRVIHYGNDLYCEIRHPDVEEPFQVTYWDLWFAIVLTQDFDGDWEEMIEGLRERSESHFYLADTYKGFANHLSLLRQALDGAQLSVDDILAEAGEDAIKRHKSRARRKILEMHIQKKEKSAWMIETPRKQREDRAMRGHWGGFPVNPEQYAGSLARCYGSSGFYNKHRSFTLERKLSAWVEKYEARASLAKIFALYRAFLTVAVEKMNMVDDSFGVIGELYQDVFEKYCRLERAKLDMQPQAFFQDLVELMIWEDYAGTSKHQPDFFAGLSSAEVPLVESILEKAWEELRELELEYHAEKALTMLGMLYVQQRIYDKFVPVARLMGTREWQRITRMAEMAVKRRKQDLALAVYEACLRPGSHEAFLREKYRDLKDKLGKKKAER